MPKFEVAKPARMTASGAAYRERRERLGMALGRVTEALMKRVAEAEAELATTENWGHVGDAGHTLELLEQLAAFLEGGKN